MTTSSTQPRRRGLQHRAVRTAVVTIVASILATTWGPAAPAATAATADLRVALPMTEDTLSVEAASGTAILVDTHYGLRLSQDSGATWVAANVPSDWSPYFRHVENGKAVSLEEDWQAGTRTIRVFSFGANAVQDYSVPIDLQAYSSTTGVGSIPGGWVSVALATGALTDLDVEESVIADGFDGDSDFVMGEATSAVRATTTRNQQTYARGDGFLDVVPLSGGVGPAPVRVPGLGDVKVVGDQVVYTTATTSGLAVCRRALTMATPASCAQVVEGDFSASWVYLSASRTWAVARAETDAGELAWLVEGGTILPIDMSALRWAFVSLRSDPVRPLVAVGTPTGSSIHQVTSDGSTSRLFGYPPAPATPRSLALTPTTVAGEDGRPSPVDVWGQGWSRSITGAGLGTETLLPTRASQVMASAGRMIANTVNGAQVFDRGVLRTTLPIDEGRWKRGRLSGPYFQSGTGRVVHTVSGETIDSSARDIFGSLALEEVDAEAGRYRVRDVGSSVAPVEFTLPDPFKGAWQPRLWGDWVAFGFDSGDYRQGTVVFNYRTNEVKTLDSEFPLDLGDGFVVLSNDEIWNFRTGERVTLDGVSGPVATDGVHRVAFATASELVVRTLEGTGTSAPRVLGTLVADSDLGVGEVWRPEIDGDCRRFG